MAGILAMIEMRGGLGELLESDSMGPKVILLNFIM